MRSWLNSTFTSVSSSHFRLVFFGSLISTGALAASNVARSALVWDLTRSNTALALQFVAVGITMVSLSPFAGTLADRWSPKSLLVMSGAMFAALQLVLGVLIVTDVIAVWQIIALSVFEGAGFAITVPARGAMIGGLVPEQTRGNAVALQQVSYNAMQVVGPAIAAALLGIALFGFGGAFFVQGGLYGVAVVLTMMLPNVRPPIAAAAGGFLNDIAEGVRYIRGRPSLLVIVLSYLVVSLTVFPYFVFYAGIVDVVFESRTLPFIDSEAVALSVLVGVGSIGAFAASVFVAGIADRGHAFTLFIGTNIAFALVLYAIAPTFEVLILVAIALNALSATFASLGQSLGLRYAHRNFHGRIPAVLTMTLGLTGFAALGYGQLADQVFGLREALLGMSGIGLVAVVGIALYARRINAWDDARSPGEEIELPPDSSRAATAPVEVAAGD